MTQKKDKKTQSYKIKFSKEANGWIVNKQNFVFSPNFDMEYIRINNSPAFSTIESAAQWIEKHYESKDSYVYFVT